MTDTSILANLLEEMMAAGRVALGMNMGLPRSVDIARIAKSCGHDSSSTTSTRSSPGDIAHTALDCGITPLARARSVAVRLRTRRPRC